MACLWWATTTTTSRAQFNEPPGQRRRQTFKVIEFESGTVDQRFDGTLRYYCTFRGKWNAQRHPNDFPRSASWSAPIMISHSNGYRMWTGTETATLGIESIAEVSFFSSFICSFVRSFIAWSSYLTRFSIILFSHYDYDYSLRNNRRDLRRLLPMSLIMRDMKHS